LRHGTSLANTLRSTSSRSRLDGGGSTITWSGSSSSHFYRLLQIDAIQVTTLHSPVSV
jgi:hypothetical protein